MPTTFIGGPLGPLMVFAATISEWVKNLSLSSTKTCDRAGNSEANSPIIIKENILSPLFIHFVLLFFYLFIHPFIYSLICPFIDLAIHNTFIHPSILTCQHLYHINVLHFLYIFKSYIWIK